MGRGLGQVTIPAESRADVSAHGLWKRGTTVMFEMIIDNLDEGSYLLMIPEKAIAETENYKKRKYISELPRV